MNFGSSKKRAAKLTVAIPASTFSDVPHLREKTLKIGLIGRALAIFRVEELLIYRDYESSNLSNESHLIASILSYMETPQYLRKHLFKIKPELRYVGILPPLRTPHHPLGSRMKDLVIGDYREGVVTSLAKHGSNVDIGTDKCVTISNIHLPVNTRVTLKIKELGKYPKARIAKKEEIGTYWGYEVTLSDSILGNLLARMNFDLVLATSRYGLPIKTNSKRIIECWKKSKTVVLLFGSATHGIKEILLQEDRSWNDFAHFIINTIPTQGAETVRIEEALYSTLAIFNAFI